MMSRKDYIAIAAALRDSDTVEDAALRIASVLAADNPRFDRARFLDAAGVSPRYPRSDGWTGPF